MRFLVIALAVALSLPLPPLTLTGGAAAEAASVAGTVISSSGQVLPKAAAGVSNATAVPGAKPRLATSVPFR